MHATDVTNASRTMLYDIRKLVWDETLLRALDIPRAMLPRVCSSSEVYGYAALQGVQVPVSGIAAISRRRCSARLALPGEAKNTYGTGCFC